MSSLDVAGGRAVMAWVDDKWYACEGEYWEYDYSDGEDLYEIAADMYELMRHSRIANGGERKGIFPDAEEVDDNIRACIKAGSFAGTPWRHIPKYDGMTSNEVRACNRSLVMIGFQKSWYIMDGNNKIVSERFPDDETLNGVYIPLNQTKAKAEFAKRFTKEEAEEAGYRLCLVLDTDENWEEILEEYTLNDIYPQN